ncbi:GyrI-like domain-containing protein [Herbiconiux sp. L3-i23]|uniref:GyrI-like domain-containing protein n=1 Tax=Herbiconiux sp. L3-i23 TaxID=2905871 RepID=UPI0020540789|nr:GyrI-like domain-containing protein [Herbiconiux sp. L3-i23]BDI22315.1 hypothetical protein L3i23_10910 [Herbiconiux sp. L3-i23]
MKIDIKKDLKAFYRPKPDDFVEVVVPPQRFLAIDGSGDPDTSDDYANAVAALYAAAYATKAASKAADGVDFIVGPLEGLWSSSDPSSFVDGRKSEWDWTMLIPLPDQLDESAVRDGLESARKKKPDLPLDRVAPLRLDEGRSLQILYIGGYDDEAPVLARLHNEVMPALGVEWNGRHHEVYLSDPRKVPAAALKTVLRQPVTDADRAG